MATQEDLLKYPILQILMEKRKASGDPRPLEDITGVDILNLSVGLVREISIKASENARNCLECLKK